MEKRAPHCKLAMVKSLIEQGKVRMTKTAASGGAALGFDAHAVVEVVRSLTTKDFYKSMTTHGDHTVWQDVYRPVTQVGQVYLKLTVIDEVLIVSFKEL